MDEMMEKMDLNTAEETGTADRVMEADVEIAAEIAAEQEAEAKLNLKDEKAVRQALEQARSAESKAYAGMTSAAALTQRQKGVLELAKLEELEHPTTEQQDEKCRLILESYYLPHIAKDGFTVKLDSKFTRNDDPEKDYIEATFTNISGKTLTVGYNYKTAEDGRHILVFEKSFQNIVLKPGEPERYVLYAPNGREIESLTMEELEEKIEAGDIVKIEQGYFRKAKDEDGIVRKGVTTPIVEIESGNGMKMSFGNNEKHRFTLGKNGQLTCATTNDVITATIETRSFSSGPVYDSAEAAKVAAQGVIQAGEANPKIEVSMEGTTVADFSYLPTLKTSVELAGLSRKLGKGMEGYDPNDSEGENLRRQFDKPIRDYLSEKGYYVLDIVCENLMADVTENVGFMNTMKTYQITGGVVAVTYIKKHTQFVSIKQGVLGRKQGNNIDAILAQLPEGSEILDPESINWKNSKEEVAYVTRGKATGVGSAKTTAAADDKAAENAIIEAQKVVARSINGSIASGIKEVIAGRGASSTVASVRARLTTGVVSKNDMQLTHRDAKYAYSGTCDKMVSTSENKLVSVTSWSGNLLTYVEAKDPIIDKGIPTDGNYDKFINEGDESGILLFEKTDVGLRRYMKEVTEAQSKTKIYRDMYIKARTNLKEIQHIFDLLIDERLGLAGTSAKQILKAETVAKTPEEEVQTEEIQVETPDGTVRDLEPVLSAPMIASGESDTEPAETAGEAVEAVEVPAEELVEEASESAEAPAEELVEETSESAEAPVIESVNETVVSVFENEAPASVTEEVTEPAAPAVDHTAAQEALLSIFGDTPEPETASASAPVEEPAAPVPAPVEEPTAPAVDHTAAQEALLSIFGDTPEPEAAPAPAPVEEPTAAAVDHTAAQEALLSIFGDMSEPEAAPAPAPVEEPTAPAVDHTAAQEALLSIFGDMPEPEAAPAIAPIEEPAAPAPAPVEKPAAPAVAHTAAQEALLSIFGDMPEPETAPAPAPIEEPAAPAPAPIKEPAAPAPAPVEKPAAPAVAHTAAQEALLSIFGDMPEPEAAPAPAPIEEPAAPAPAPIEEPAAPAPAPVEEPVAPAVDRTAAQEALLSIFGDMSDTQSTMPVAEIQHRKEEQLVFEGESDMPVAPRPVTENHYERPEAPRTAGSDLYVRPMPVIAEGETIARPDRSEYAKPSISLDGTFVVPLPDMPDIQIQRMEGAPVGSSADASAVDAAWEKLMNGVTDEQ